MKATKLAAVMTMLLVASPALAAGPIIVDPNGPNSGAGRAFAQAPEPSPTNPESPISGVDRTVAGGWPTPAEPNGPNSGVGRGLAAYPSPVDPYGTTTSGAGRSLS